MTPTRIPGAMTHPRQRPKQNANINNSAKNWLDVCILLGALPRVGHCPGNTSTGAGAHSDNRANTGKLDLADVHLAGVRLLPRRRAAYIRIRATHIQASSHTGVRLSHRRAPKAAPHIGIACISYMAMHLIHGRASHTWACTSYMGVHLTQACISGLPINW